MDHYDIFLALTDLISNVSRLAIGLHISSRSLENPMTSTMYRRFLRWSDYTSAFLGITDLTCFYFYNIIYFSDRSNVIHKMSGLVTFRCYCALKLSILFDL